MDSLGFAAPTASASDTHLERGALGIEGGTNMSEEQLLGELFAEIKAQREEIRAQRDEIKSLKDAVLGLPPAHTPPLVVTKQEAARLLSRSLTTLARMLDAGEILSVDVHGTEMIPMSEVQRVATPAPPKSKVAQRRIAPRPSVRAEADSIDAALRKRR